MTTRPVTIVLADDDDGHVTLVKRNLQRLGLTNPVVRVVNGQEAVDLLKNAGSFAGKRPEGPLLLVLDVNMPVLDGIEALRQIKSDPQLSVIPVIMLTTTDDPREVERCYQLGCNIYITKPVAYDAFIDAISRLGLFLQIVQVPQ